MWPNFINMLNWWQWTLLALVPPAIIALYFLKLKRYPLEIPSTYLWHRSIEDIHVNTIWQKLRRNLLLFLQLLLIALAILALLRPGWRSEKLLGDRFIFMVDNSASMQATDTKASRLEKAKRVSAEFVELMNPGDVAMLVSFADTARIEQMFTDNRRQLLRGLERIEPTQRSTSLVEALKVASGLANPGRSAPDSTDVQVAEAMPATLYIFSDGKFEPTTDPLGNLFPMYKPIGTSGASNVGIMVFNVRRNEAKPDQLQAFAQVRNFGSEPASVELELWVDDELNIDAKRTTIAAGETQSFHSDLGVLDTGKLELRVVATGDDLALDDKAWAVISPPSRAKVLVVTPGNQPLTLAMATDAAAEFAEVTVQTPDFLVEEDGPYRQQAAIGAYDLVIYDRCRPEKMPQANTLFIDALPPIKIRKASDAEPAEPDAGEELWKRGASAGSPRIIDVDPAHPLTQWIDMSDVLIVRGTPLEVPPGGSVLMDSHLGPMLVVAPREEYEDVVLGFALVSDEADDTGSVQHYVNTTWHARASFPTFIFNMLHYLGDIRTASGMASIRPGQPRMLESPDVGKPLKVVTPSGKKIRLPKSELGKFNFTQTGELGVYEVFLEDELLEQFAVNLFHPLESDIATRKDIEVGRVPVAGKGEDWEISRRELWRLLLLIGLGVLLFEWYVFHRRVYL